MKEKKSQKNRSKLFGKALALLLALALTVCLLPAAALAEGAGVQWAGAGNMNSGNNQVTSTALPESSGTIEQKWSQPVSSGGAYGNYASSFVIADGFLYILSSGSTLYKINTSTGATESTTLTGASGLSGWYFNYMICGGGKLYVSSDNSIMAYSLSALNWGVGASNDATWKVSDNFGNFRTMQYLTCGSSSYIWCNGKVFDVSNEEAKTLCGADGSTPLSDTFSWSSGAVAGNYFCVTSSTKIYAINMADWTVSDSWQYLDSGSSSCTGQTVYDSASGRLFWGAKDSFQLSSVKIDSSAGKFLADSGIKAKTSVKTDTAPVVYNGTVYLAGQDSASGTVADVFSYTSGTAGDTLNLRYSVSGTTADGTVLSAVQSSPILSTASASDANDHTVRLYLQPNVKDANLYVLEDSASAGSGTLQKLTSVSTGDNSAYAYEPFGFDSTGNLYFYNEHGWVYCWGFKTASGTNAAATPVITTNLNTSAVHYAPGEAAAPLSVKVESPSDGGVLTYQWQLRGNGDAGYTDIASQNLPSCTPAEISGTVSYRVKVTNTLNGSTSIVYSAATPVTYNTPASPITVYVTLSRDASIVTGADTGKTLLAQASVTASDRNRDGNIDIDEVLYAAHEKYYSGGAAAGYETKSSQYGLGITKLWGDTSGNYGYWVNNASAWSLSDTVSAGEFVTAFVYKDKFYSDTYTAFTSDTVSAAAGQTVTLTLKAYSWDNSSYKYVSASYAGASISAAGTSISGTTGADGSVSLIFPAAGTYKVIASYGGVLAGSVYTSAPIVPAVCTVTIADAPVIPSTDINVTFSLLGDTAHGAGGGTHTLSGGNLTSWIGSSSVTVSSGSSVGDVFKEVLDGAGYKYVGLDKGYVSSITSPSGVTLSSQTNGSNSGWMYAVNGSHPGVGLNDYTLSSGDAIVFHYTDDYLKESGMSSAGGGAGTSSAVISPDSAVSGNAAVSSVTGQQVAAAVKAAVAAADTGVTIVPQNTGNAASVSVTIPASAAKSVADTKLALTADTASGSVTIPGSALSSIASRAFGNDITITVEKKTAADVMDKSIDTDGAVIAGVTVTCGGKAITDFGGSSLTVNLPVSGTFAEGHSYKVIEISADGAEQVLSGRCVSIGGRLYVQFSVSHLSTIVLLVGKAFADVGSTTWYGKAVEYVSGRGLMNGTGSDIFSPGKAMTRAMLVTALYRLEGCPTVVQPSSGFSDCREGDWFLNAVAWANGAGIAQGFGDGRFGANDPVTREQAAVILYRYAQYKNLAAAASADLAAFSDSGSVSTWAKDSVPWCVLHGIITGRASSLLSPSAVMSRAESAAVLMRFCEKFAL